MGLGFRTRPILLWGNRSFGTGGGHYTPSSQYGSPAYRAPASGGGSYGASPYRRRMEGVHTHHTHHTVHCPNTAVTVANQETIRLPLRDLYSGSALPMIDSKRSDAASDFRPPPLADVLGGQPKYQMPSSGASSYSKSGSAANHYPRARAPVAQASGLQAQRVNNGMGGPVLGGAGGEYSTALFAKRTLLC
jgi:hypothetical protein